MSLDDLKAFSVEELRTKLGIDKEIFAKKIFKELKNDKAPNSTKGTQGELRSVVDNVKISHSQATLKGIATADDNGALNAISVLAENFQSNESDDGSFLKEGTNTFLQRKGGFPAEAVRGYSSLNLRNLKPPPGKKFAQQFMLVLKDFVQFLENRSPYLDKRVEAVSGDKKAEWWPKEQIFNALNTISTDRAYSAPGNPSVQFAESILLISFPKTDEAVPRIKIDCSVALDAIDESVLDRYEDMWKNDEYAADTDLDPELELDMMLSSLSKMDVESALKALVDQGDPSVLYTNQKFLARGASGDVFSAFDFSQRKVAIKKIMINPKDSKSISVEVTVMKAVKHPNVIPLFGAYLLQNQLWLVMELMDGGDLKGLIEKKKHFSEPQIAYVIRESLRGLAYCHSLNRIHRDIKSDNILLTKEGHVKLSDFGYAHFTCSSLFDFPLTMHQLECRADKLRAATSDGGRNALLDGARNHQRREVRKERRRLVSRHRDERAD
jgi:tRNA A-37 threonylcarbamoyl transferase component Bud32